MFYSVQSDRPAYRAVTEVHDGRAARSISGTRKPTRRTRGRATFSICLSLTRRMPAR